MDAAIDAGGSCTDVLLAEGRRILVSRTLQGHHAPEASTGVLDEVRDRFGIPRRLFVTGARASRVSYKELTLTGVDEMTAIGRGAQRLAEKSTCLAVSMGTGTAIVHADGDEYRHLGGTGVGGATLVGLGRLILDEGDPDVLQTLARDGDSTHVDLTVGDLGYGTVGILTPDTTAANLGKLDSRSPEDLAAAIHTLVGEVVGTVASQAAHRAGSPNDIVVLGRPAANPVLRAVLGRVGRLFGTRFTFPDDGSVGVAVGALKEW